MKKQALLFNYKDSYMKCYFGLNTVVKKRIVKLFIGSLYFWNAKNK